MRAFGCFFRTSRRNRAAASAVLLVLGPQSIALSEPAARQVQASPNIPARRAIPSDIGAQDPDRNAILKITGQGALLPDEAGRFRPQEAVTRAEFATALQNVFGLATPRVAVSFPDLRPGSSLYNAAAATARYSDRQIFCPGCALGNNFLPNEPITRAELAVAVVRILAERGQIKLLGPQDSALPIRRIGQSNSLAVVAQQYIATAEHAGILSIRGDTALSGTVSRADFAALLARLEDQFSLRQ